MKTGVSRELDKPFGPVVACVCKLHVRLAYGRGGVRILSSSCCVDWSPVVRVAAIACSAAENGDACRHYSVFGFPTLKVRLPANM